MKVGKVVGSIWATRKVACLQGQTFLVVEAEGEKIVAADQATGCCWPREPWLPGTAWTPR